VLRDEFGPDHKRPLWAPTDSAIRVNYADGLVIAKRYDEAIEQYKIAISLPNLPDLGRSQIKLGNACMAAGRVKEAIKVYKEASRLAMHLPLLRKTFCLQTHCFSR